MFFLPFYPSFSLDYCTTQPQLFLLVNPYGKPHGGPTDTERHVGDLGNIQTDDQGNAYGSVADGMIKLIGEESILGVCCDPRIQDKARD